MLQHTYCYPTQHHWVMTQSLCCVRLPDNIAYWNSSSCPTRDIHIHICLYNYCYNAEGCCSIKYQYHRRPWVLYPKDMNWTQWVSIIIHVLKFSRMTSKGMLLLMFNYQLSEFTAQVIFQFSMTSLHICAYSDSVRNSTCFDWLHQVWTHTVMNRLKPDSAIWKTPSWVPWAYFVHI